MGKSINMNRSASMPSAGVGGATSGGGIDVIDIVEKSVSAIKSITSIISTIGEERRKTQTLKLEGTKIKAEIEDRISERENETKRILKEYDVQLKKINIELDENKYRHKENMRRIDNQRVLNNNRHKERMKALEIMEKVIMTILDQYTRYQSDIQGYQQADNYELIKASMNSMNGIIQNLTTMMAPINERMLFGVQSEE